MPSITPEIKTELPTRISDSNIWIGNSGHIRSVAGLQFVFRQEIKFVVDLADKETLPDNFPRTTISYCRFPISDTSENDPALLGMAIRYVTLLLKEKDNILITCSYGMSRSPLILAGAWYLMDPSKSVEEYLFQIKQSRQQMDIDVGLLFAVKQQLNNMR